MSAVETTTTEKPLAMKMVSDMEANYVDLFTSLIQVTLKTQPWPQFNFQNSYFQFGLSTVPNLVMNFYCLAVLLLKQQLRTLDFALVGLQSFTELLFNGFLTGFYQLYEANVSYQELCQDRYFIFTFSMIYGHTDMLSQTNWVSTFWTYLLESNDPGSGIHSFSDRSLSPGIGF